MDSEKLQKVLARSGLGSRREVESWIAQGRVGVNGKAAQVGCRVTPQDRLTLDGRPLKVSDPRQACRVILYNKPLGEVCTRNDPEGRPLVFDRLPRLPQGRWIAVGRLDINTSGLLVLTTDGELANRLMHPSSGVDREYAVRIHGRPSEETLRKLTEGVLLDDGLARFTDLRYFDGSGSNHWYHVVLMEGRNREVRRLWESQGLEVSRLKRVRYGCLFLPSRLAMGCWEELNQKGLNELCDSLGLERRRRQAVPASRAQAEKRLKRRPRPPGRARRSGY